MGKPPKLGTVNGLGLKPGAQMILDVKGAEYDSDMAIRLTKPHPVQVEEVNENTGIILLTNVNCPEEGML